LIESAKFELIEKRKDGIRGFFFIRKSARLSAGSKQLMRKEKRWKERYLTAVLIVEWLRLFRRIGRSGASDVIHWTESASIVIEL